MKCIKQKFDSYIGKSIEQLLYQQDSETLVIVLPGQNYSAKGPVLYYPTELCLERGYDVLVTRYGYEVGGLNYNKDDFWTIAAEIKQALNWGLSQNSYKRIVFLAKSIGTVFTAAIIAEYKARYQIFPILLTPIPEFTNQIIDLDQFVAYGSADRYITDQNHQHYASLDHVVAICFDGADHSLMVNRTVESIEIIYNLVEAIDQYLDSIGV